MAKAKKAAEKEAAKAAKAAEKEAAIQDDIVVSESPSEITLEQVVDKANQFEGILVDYIKQQTKKGKSIDRFTFVKRQIERIKLNNLIP